jgi:hypothetical protein
MVAGVKKKKVDAAHLVDVQALLDLLQYKHAVSASGILSRIKQLKLDKCDEDDIRHNAANVTDTMGTVFKPAAAALVPAIPPFEGFHMDPSTVAVLNLSLVKPYSPLCEIGEGEALQPNLLTGMVAKCPQWLKLLIQDSPIGPSRSELGVVSAREVATMHAPLLSEIVATFDGAH